MAPMQDDPGVCVNHATMAKQVSEIHSFVCGNLLANPPVKGMAQEHQEMWQAHQDKIADGKDRRRFVWEHIVGYLLTGGLATIGTILAIGHKKP